tara:strand:- start:212 stop:1048 length:837 start_codon:yes stop_codon:yes gene_type:complete
MDHCSNCETQKAFPSELHVSTQTQLGKINATIELSELAKSLNTSSNILYVEYGDDIRKGDNAKKSARKHKKAKPQKYFYNQVTIHIRRENDKRVNMKIFNNGRVQMTGVIKSGQGLEKMRDLIKELNSISAAERVLIFGHSDIIDHVPETETVLINSNFDIGFEIDREALHRLIIQEGYYSSYEPGIYPGVNIKYYYNPLNVNPGICNCTLPCDGKGTGNACKRITVAAFKSGKIIITGGRSDHNIVTAYNFIRAFISEHIDEIKVNAMIEVLPTPYL